MSLSIDDVRRVAKLARIGLTQDEAVAMQQQLHLIFDLIETMRTVDTRDIEPMAHAQAMVLRLREDTCTQPSDRHTQWEALSPAFKNGLYWVPEVIS